VTDTAVLIYRGSRPKTLGSAVLLLLLGVLSLTRNEEDPLNQKFWYALAAFLLIVAVVTAVLALRGMPRLTLTREGFEMASGLGTRMFPWSECYAFSAKMFFLQLSGVSFFRKGFSGEQAILNLYDVPTEELCSTLRSWSQKCGGLNDDG
jgi:hypothetical protein